MVILDVLAGIDMHQPRLSAYEVFDQLLLLRRGQLVYGGPAGAEATTYFDNLGFALPNRANPADFFIEICFGFVDSTATPPVAPAELAAKWKLAYAEQLKHRYARTSSPQTHGHWVGPKLMTPMCSAQEYMTLQQFELYWLSDPWLRMIDLSAMHAIFCQCKTRAPGASAEVAHWEALQKGISLTLVRS